MNSNNKNHHHKPDPAIAINSLLSCADDCLTRAGDRLDPQTFCPVDAAYVDDQLYRASVYIAKARAIAVTTHGVAGLIPLPSYQPWKADDVIELAPETDASGGKGGDA